MNHRLFLLAVVLPLTFAPRSLGDAGSPPVEFRVPGSPAPLLPLEGFKGIGMMFVKNNRLDRLDWSEAQIAAFASGVEAALRGDRSYDQAATQRVGTEIIRRVRELDRKKSTDAGEFDDPVKLAAYLKETKKRLRMQVADSGLLFLVQGTGRGARPTEADTVVVSIVGKDADGEEALEPISGEHIRIKVVDLLPGLREGVQMLAVGSEAVFVLPPQLSFGRDDWPEGVGRGQPLTFAVTLHEVISGTK